MEKRYIGKELRMLNNTVRRYLDRNTHKCENDKITCSNSWIIGYLSDTDHDVYQRDLENEFNITRSTASKVLILLEKKGLILRESVPQDARLKKLVLTDKARSLVATMRSDGEQMEAHLVDGFSDEEIEQLISYFDRMRANLAKTIY